MRKMGIGFATFSTCDYNNCCFSQLRRDGMRLFLIWYQILQDNASEECHQIFLQLIPGLGDGIHQDILNCRVAVTPDSKLFQG